MATVDVIVPLYNKEMTIERTIRSIQNQTFVDWNLIVVDDGSQDQGPQRVEQILDSRIRLIRQSNQGPGAARNAGIAAASATFVAFLDADDEWYPHYLENAVKVIRDNPVSFVASMYMEWPKEQDMTMHWKRRGVIQGTYQLQGDESISLIESLIFFLHVGTILIKKEIVEKYDGFYQEEKCLSGEDSVFFARLVFNEPFAVIGPAAVRHNRQDSGLSNTRDRPEIPFLLKPEIVLDYISVDMHPIADLVLTRMALRTAHHLARNGYGKRAKELLNRFPLRSHFFLLDCCCRLEILLSPVLPYWVRFKCFVGPKVHQITKGLKKT